VEVGPEDVTSLVESFPPPDFYLSADAVHDALKQPSMFNLLALSEGEKVDFWLLTKSAFDQSRFARKAVMPVMGIDMNVSSPEDTILMKLCWAKLCGGSEKHIGDALGVFEVQRGHLDLTYLNQWASELGVVDLWTKLQAEAEPI